MSLQLAQLTKTKSYFIRMGFTIRSSGYSIEFPEFIGLQIPWDDQIHMWILSRS